MSTNDKMRFDLFQKFVAEARNKMKADEFCDVILVSQDSGQFAAHKVILASSSEVFKNILVNVRHPHPLIFLSGVKSTVLQAVLDFIYSGEAQIENEEKEAFMKLCVEFKVFGLHAEVFDNESHTKKKACRYWNNRFCKRRENCEYKHI